MSGCRKRAVPERFSVEAGCDVGKLHRVRISIVVPAFNEEKLIGDSLREMKRASCAFNERGWEWELIVCDNNSTDRTAELARAEGAMVVFEKVNQIARARNTGARAASGGWLLFVDADSHPSTGLFREAAAQMEGGMALAGGSTVTLQGAGLAARCVCGAWNRLSRFAKWAAGSFLFCRTGAFWEVGGFNESYYASEEIDLSRRLKILAKQRDRRVVILHRHPLVTSARKLELYSTWEHLRFLLKTVAGGGRTLRNQAACPIWYDGRR
jgi:glycosyltransferase involved in cell wall biosynthesis